VVLEFSSTPCWLGTPGGHFVDRVPGVRHAHELGLRPVDEVPEHPADAYRPLVAETVREDAQLAEKTAAAGLDAGEDDVVANCKGGERAAHLRDHTDTLVTENAPAKSAGKAWPEGTGPDARSCLKAADSVP